MVLYKLFTKEEHKKIEREKRKFDSLKPKDKEKFCHELSASQWWRRSTHVKPTHRDIDYMIMAYLADKE